MADISIDLYEDNDAIVGTDLTEIYQPASGGIRREKKVTETKKADWYADNMVFDNGLKLKLGIIALQDLVATSVTTAGYYTFSKSEDTADNIASAKFRVVTDSGADVIEVDFEESASAKTHSNTKIEILRSKVGVIRLAKSDSVNGSGSKVQIYISGATDIKVYLEANTGNNAGFQLVTPYLDNTPTLPDGVTVGTFLVAGEELSILSVSSRFHQIPFVIARVLNPDSIEVTVDWGQIPKTGTGLTITESSGGFAFNNCTGISTAISSSHTISNFTQDSRTVMFTYTETGKFSSFAVNEILFLLVTGGATGKFTIT